MSKQKRPREQISGIVGGHIVPATETPLLTSASTPWSGFLLEKHNAGDRQDVNWGWHRAHISLITKGQIGFRVRSLRGGQDFVGQAGSVCVFPSGYDETHFAIAGAKFEAIVVELDPARLEALLGREMVASTQTLVPQIVVRDRYMAKCCSGQWLQRSLRTVPPAPSTGRLCLWHWRRISSEDFR
jgi:hypothetical protein